MKVQETKHSKDGYKRALRGKPRQAIQTYLKAFVRDANAEKKLKLVVRR